MTASVSILRALLLAAAISSATLPAAAQGGSGARELVVPFQAFGAVQKPEALRDEDPGTVATVDSSPAKLFLLLDEEALLEAVVVHGSMRFGSITVELSEDALAWTRVEVTVRRGARPGEVRLVFPEPVLARAIMLTIPFEGASLSLGGVRVLAAAPDLPNVTSVAVSELAEGAATVSWRTDRPATTMLLYGFRPDGMKTWGDPGYERRKDHNVRLTGLLPGTEYRAWIVVGRDSVVGSAPGQPIRFRTTGTPLPFATGFRHALGRDSAVIRFQVNIPARAVLEWREVGSEAVRPASSEAGEALATDHAVRLEGLEPRGRYEYQVIATDSRGRATATPWIAFATEPFNLAEGRPAAGTFSVLLEEQAAADTRPALARVTDGRNDYFRGMATSGDPGETDQWVEVDLGQPSRLATIEMIWRGNAYPRSYYVMTSTDRVNWSYPGFGIDAEAGEFERSSGGDPLRRVRLGVDAAEAVRYIRIFIPRGSAFQSRTSSWRFVQLAEIEAHGHWER